MPRGSVYRHEIVNRPASLPDQSGALVASSRIYEAGTLDAQSLRKTGRRTRSSAWQNDLWDMYDLVPEFRAGCSWVGNLLSKAVLMVYKDGKPTTDPAALDALASLYGGPEGQEEMLRLLGINFTVAGEAFLVGLPRPNGDDEWEVIASTEVQGETTNNITIEGEPVPDGTLAIRLWKAHPRKSNESDCPARALLPTLNEIVRLSQVVAAQADSRLKGNGILFVPSELEMPSIPVITENELLEEQVSLQDTTSISEGLTRRLIRIASIAMQDRDSAAAAVPLVIAAPGEYLEKVQWIDFWSGFDEYVQKLRDEARRSIGIGLDMPPEVITGTADVNHWGAWQIEEAAIKIHTEPLLGVIESSLTTGYLHPILRAWGVEDWKSYTFEANTAALRLRPNRSKEAVELWDRGALSMETLLIENGFDPSTDIPSEREQIRFFLSQIARKTSATPDQLAAALAGLGLQGMPGEASVEQRGALERPSLEQHPDRSAPDPDESEADDAVAVRASASAPVPQAFIVDGLLLACEVLVDRALERAGNRLKSRIGRNIGAPAAELYLQAPRLDRSECEDLLVDAWGALDRRDYGVDKEQLREALQDYTLTLLRLQKPYERATLARVLLLQLAGDEAA